MYHVKLYMDKGTYEYNKYFTQCVNVVFIVFHIRLVKSSFWLQIRIRIHLFQVKPIIQLVHTLVRQSSLLKIKYVKK